MSLSRSSFIIAFLLTVPVGVFAQNVLITPETEEKIMMLKEIRSISAILTPYATVATSSVGFKSTGCAQSRRKDDAKYFLQVINDTSGLPSTYVPKNLVNINSHIKTWAKTPVCLTRSTASHLYTMIQDMAKEKLHLVVVSGYRSYAAQKAMYTNTSAKLNSGSHDRVAPPGFSEHQLGTSVDVSSLTVSGTSFGTTSESIWLQENAHKYGFIISYNDGKQDKTGYMYEPWHLRFIGIENATLLKKGDYTLSYKPMYYRSAWMQTLLNRLQEYVTASVARVE